MMSPRAILTVWGCLLLYCAAVWLVLLLVVLPAVL